MTLAIYFRLALFIPVVLALPVMIWPAASTIFLFQTAVLALFAAAIPYAIFVIVTLIWSFKKSDKALFKASWLMPPIFAGICFLYFLLVPNQITFGESYDVVSTIFLSVVALLYAYFCVFTAFAVWAFIQLLRGRIQIS